MFETDGADRGASWIPAGEALRIVTDRLGEADARPAIVAGAHKGAIKTRARLFTHELPNACGRKPLLEDHFVELPPEFWWADVSAFDQDWAAGDFATLIHNNLEWQAFGVEFDQAGISAIAGKR
jgi:hypothetical protein